jgi:hypothetical protein
MQQVKVSELASEFEMKNTVVISELKNDLVDGARVTGLS